MPDALQPGDALLVVDVQNDFLPGGALGVTDGDTVVAPLNRWLARFTAAGLPVYASRDWHPADHCSFHAQGGPWPPHCVAGTPGADFAPALELPPQAAMVYKGSDRDAEAYSAFAGTGLEQALRAQGVRRIFIGGLATEYCVLNTVRDAVQAGLDAVVLADAVRPVDVHAGDGAAALATMRSLGAALLHESHEIG